METFGQWLRNKRIEKGLNQETLGIRAGGISRAAISLYEKDEIKQPRLSQLKHLAIALDIPFEELMSVFSRRLFNKALPSNDADGDFREVVDGVYLKINLKAANLTTDESTRIITALELLYKGMQVVKKEEVRKVAKGNTSGKKPNPLKLKKRK